MPQRDTRHQADDDNRDRDREYGRGDRDFHREERGGSGENRERGSGERHADRDLGERSFGRAPGERWEMGGWESGPRREGDDERGQGSYRRYGRGAYAQGGYRQGGYGHGQRDSGQHDFGQRDFGETGYRQHDYGPGNYGRGGVGDGGFGHYGESSGTNQGRRGHEGRGPRGYKRSDERIHEDVCDCLMQDPYVDASDIEIKVADGIVTLEGTVDSRRVKHIAENLCESIPGVQDVTNHLRIKRDESSRERPPTSSGSGRSGRTH